MAASDLPNPTDLRQMLRYEPDTGRIFWQADASPCHPKMAGREAFATRHNRGYFCGGLFRRTLLAHRVAWALHYGEWPTDHIDHINGNRQDNRIANLRVVDYAGNARNCKRRANNTSGVTGVSWAKGKGAWIVMVARKRIGYFKTFGEAVLARKEAARRAGYHPNHGRN